MSECANCHDHNKKLSICSGCKDISYCSKKCQRTDWTHHKKDCQLHVKNLINLLCLELNGEISTKCHNCNETKRILNRCTQCEVAHYCSTGCRKESSHDRICGLLIGGNGNGNGKEKDDKFNQLKERKRRLAAEWKRQKIENDKSLSPVEKKRQIDHLENPKPSKLTKLPFDDNFERIIILLRGSKGWIGYLAKIASLKDVANWSKVSMKFNMYIARNNRFWYWFLYYRRPGTPFESPIPADNLPGDFDKVIDIYINNYNYRKLAMRIYKALEYDPTALAVSDFHPDDQKIWLAFQGKSLFDKFRALTEKTTGFPGDVSMIVFKKILNSPDLPNTLFNWSLTSRMFNQTLGQSNILWFYAYQHMTGYYEEELDHDKDYKQLIVEEYENVVIFTIKLDVSPSLYLEYGEDRESPFADGDLKVSLSDLKGMTVNQYISSLAPDTIQLHVDSEVNGVGNADAVTVDAYDHLESGWSWEESGDSDGAIGWPDVSFTPPSLKQVVSGDFTEDVLNLFFSSHYYYTSFSFEFHPNVTPMTPEGKMWHETFISLTDLNHGNKQAERIENVFPAFYVDENNSLLDPFGNTYYMICERDPNEAEHLWGDDAPPYIQPLGAVNYQAISDWIAEQEFLMDEMGDYEYLMAINVSIVDDTDPSIIEYLSGSVQPPGNDNFFNPP